MHLLSLKSRSLHCPVFINCLQFFVVPRGEYDPPLLELVRLDEDGLGKRNPDELGVRDYDAASFEKDFPSVCVLLLACPPLGDLPRGEYCPRGDLPGEFLGEWRPSDERPLVARPVRDPWLLTDLSLESLEVRIPPG